ncbi:hypothetical protein B296_00027139 [Ensete ventricosum]|uniref:Uncharacterized protein n=1 Tax=Ensete ventricosum TaxID=4639 RepID=A0A427A3W2_ENSVE|nr:hypothetical protein B296_00027139 [Ensete ventricosum]
MCTIRYGTYQGSPYRSVLAYRDLAGMVQYVVDFGRYMVCSSYRPVQGGPCTGKPSDRYVPPVPSGIGRYGKPWEVRIGLRGYQYADFLLPDDANVLTNTEAY